ncbi:MAG: trans-aconitate 2-methyltransferase [Nocardioidaceae bacterium]|nr:trans-aconitate 2-methyltransferase [Nocardioidaceae bacterium]
MVLWDPAHYLRFSDERSRPFYDLLARVEAEDPDHVVDLGCGPGQLTRSLATKWPGAAISGIDSSVAMVEAAPADDSAEVRFEVGDIRHWQPADPVDVLISNAALQWVPGHRELLPQLIASVAPGGWFAFQVPGNFDEPSHRLLRDLASDPRFAAATAGVEWPSAHDAATYLGDLSALGCRVDAWETTYLHVLTGPDPVFTWISGTGARPVLQALSAPQREMFEVEYKALLRTAYPAQAFGTLLPFRRIFVVAHKGSP